MARFIVSYDLRKPNYTEADYEDMYSELESLNAKHIQDSVWAVRSESGAEAIFDSVRQHMHEKDRLLVVGFDAFKNVNGITKLKDV